MVACVLLRDAIKSPRRGETALRFSRTLVHGNPAGVQFVETLLAFDHDISENFPKCFRHVFGEHFVVQNASQTVHNLRGFHTDAVLQILQGIGVDFAQGYGIGKPRPIAELGDANYVGILTDTPIERYG